MISIIFIMIIAFAVLILVKYLSKHANNDSDAEKSKKKVPTKRFFRPTNISQILPDPQVWDAEVKTKAASILQSQIDSLGTAINKNPSYLEYLKWQALQNIAQTGSSKGTNTLIISDGNNNPTGIVVNPQPYATVTVTPTPAETPTLPPPTSATPTPTK